MPDGIKINGAGDVTAVDEKCLSPPSYTLKRQSHWNQLKKNYEANLERLRHDNISNMIAVKLILPNGQEMIETVSAYSTTALSIISNVNPKLSKKMLAVRVDGDQVKDCTIPLQEDCTLEPINYDDKEGRDIFWHSSAHILGEALEQFYGCDLCYGPTIEEGFYYDSYMDSKTIAASDLHVLEYLCKLYIKEAQPFERLEISKSDLLELFSGNKFKEEIINKKIGEKASVYRCGTLIDMCRGPHVPNTSMIKFMKITKNSSSYWEGDSKKDHLQRVYGISFQDKKEMIDWVTFQKEAALRNHRKIGIDQELFFFNEMSPGSCFFYPKGAHIYNKLVDLIKDEYRNRGFSEVITPNVFNHKLWITSGHWEHYADNMFVFESEKTKFAMKPMNCPGHCLMFASKPRSWKDLPIRYADFGVLHRNEASGALSGLTRVRRFQQDDAHIFCATSQLKDEIKNCLDFMKWTYGIFDFKFDLQLSTMPEKHLGEEKTWRKAEKQLSEAMDETGIPWTLNPGDGAFYGPKIDITIRDALRRQHQCATIQLDFQLPQRFGLSFVGDVINEAHTPVMIHRAILGSVERMMGILTEHYAGKWPFWLSPRQACVVPVASAYDDYAKQVYSKVFKAGFEIETKLDPTMSMNKKVRTAQVVENFNFILVVGEEEKTSNTVNVRTREGTIIGKVDIDELIRRFSCLARSRSNQYENDFTDVSSLCESLSLL